MLTLSFNYFAHGFGVSRTHASHLSGSIAGVPCSNVYFSHHSVPVTSSNSLLRDSCVSQWLQTLVSLSDQRVACMLLFTAWPFSTSLWDVLGFPCTSSRSTMMSLRAFFAVLSFFPTLFLCYLHGHYILLPYLLGSAVWLLSSGL